MAIMSALETVMPGAGRTRGSGRIVAVCAFQVRDSMGPLNQCPAGHLIMALSRGPSVERMMNRHLTSAGSPHLAAPSSSW
jgi:hypothetical protein